MYKFIKKENAKIVIGGAVGYLVFWFASHPTRSPLRRRLPHKRIKNISFLPEIKIKRKDKEYHLHHWLNLSSLYVLLYLKRKRVIRSKFLNGLIFGSIIQGLSYKDRFKVVQRIPAKIDTLE